MDLSNDILITCGTMDISTRKFNEQTKIEHVRKFISESFSSISLNSYRIVYYDTSTMSFVDLEDQLRNGFNPFQSNSSTSVESTSTMPTGIRLFVVKNSSINPQTGRNSYSLLININAYFFKF